MPEIFDNNPNANVELNKYFPQSFSFIESLNNLIEYVKSLPIEPTEEILNKIEALENEFLTVKKASEDATADVTELTGKYVSLLQQVTTLAVNVSGFNGKTESIEAELQGIQENITNIKNKNTEQDNSITTINQEISGINEDITHNGEDIQDLRGNALMLKGVIEANTNVASLSRGIYAVTGVVNESLPSSYGVLFKMSDENSLSASFFITFVSDSRAGFYYYSLRSNEWVKLLDKYVLKSGKITIPKATTNHAITVNFDIGFSQIPNVCCTPINVPNTNTVTICVKSVTYTSVTFVVTNTNQSTDYSASWIATIN